MSIPGFYENPSPSIGACVRCGGALTAGHQCPMRVESQPKKKASYIGAPAVFLLEIACKTINDAFGGYGCYVVGSALERSDWRDVDVRMILSDSEFAALFPNAGPQGQWEFDPRWTLLTTAISMWLRQQTGLPVDFQIQPQTHANERHKGPRSAVGLKIMHSTASPQAVAQEQKP